MHSPKQPTSRQHHINQVSLHRSVQTIILEIAYTVSNSSPLGKEIMIRTLPWKENMHVANDYDWLIIDVRFPAKSSLFMLDFIIAFIVLQWKCYIFYRCDSNNIGSMSCFVRFVLDWRLPFSDFTWWIGKVLLSF